VSARQQIVAVDRLGFICAMDAWRRAPRLAHDEVLALDRSVRTFDKDGHLHVEMANVAKACVSPYGGQEIPGWDALGLDPYRTYQLYRDPKELEKATPSFAGKPILIKHTPLDANDHPFEKVIGAVGSDVRFNAPYIQAALTFWPGEAIDLIKSGKQRQLSAGYAYRPDMTPGNIEGESFDGVMRDIRFNHLALVVEGRQGADIVVGDSRENLKMAQMAADAQVRRDAVEKTRRYLSKWPEARAGWRPTASKRRSDV